MSALFRELDALNAFKKQSFNVLKASRAACTATEMADRTIAGGVRTVAAAYTAVNPGVSYHQGREHDFRWA
ncbi:hypothetical protein [Jeotgalibacillus salarius]|uniref:Uncharacterized protein n=1 Tax=Jeotgalibacillus salarius TaxID=546023 RepID=A0A4Y8LLU3_9BACL|nr:hypothetical protein [Jeotgalibacillus salarius]TFE03926.1 hypothetical protein E2626_00955 [Jeotgalibacillus salarius]